MTESFLPVVAPEIRARFPDYRALSVVIRGFEPGAVAAALSFEPAPWIDAHIEAWRAAFRAFGANPKKTASSVESLLKRLRKDGQLPAVNPVVDLYNALSIRFGAPFGGEDLDCYAGMPRLVAAVGNEPFDTARDGQPVVENPEPGEIVWRDEKGVTCRRWNWRQCRRTALRPDSRNLWFVIDRLGPMPLEKLHEAGEELAHALRKLSPGLTCTATLLEP